jgi:hypothetical protein
MQTTRIFCDGKQDATHIGVEQHSFFEEGVELNLGSIGSVVPFDRVVGVVAEKRNASGTFWRNQAKRTATLDDARPIGTTGNNFIPGNQRWIDRVWFGRHDVLLVKQTTETTKPRKPPTVISVAWLSRAFFPPCDRFA